MVKGNGTNELNEILRTITDLVSFKTTGNNFPEFEKAVAYVEKFFEGENVFIRKHYYNNIPALFITVNDTNKPHILLQGHLDVVNGNDEQFQPKIVGDKLYGRGTVDMKGFVALAMHALRKAAREGNDVGLMITFDEEIGSENGTKRLVEEEGYSCDILFNGDGGYNYAVIYGEKGILKFELEVEAEPGRHPYPWDGENAFDLFIEDYRRITKLFPESKYATDADNWHTTYSIYDVKVYNDEFYPPRKVTAKMNIYFSDDITTDELC
jgi:succinyl-diaminopimelate desuccinylase